ncbi:hypothetical protein BJL95_13110 [Methylomonas sp. LWB]|jgi:hypothetical protein|uniref:TrfB-related DNA-binding protein n=1 Tax=Methylomonas sp. LWB TaxID=1905845 RepID=UPI0008D9C7BE|nr:TrfB-related DNA-binding protein [Methylomonas sp. LWB]OHX36525.1 hypothetical protein BJL95_13110 [Methylomonas sp. LWB]
MPAKRRLTEREFASVRPLLRISPERQDAAYAVLVANESYTTVAAQYGCSRQSIGDAVNSVWDTYQKVLASQAAEDDSLIPPGWERVTLVAPTEIISAFRNVINAFRHESEKSGH